MWFPSRRLPTSWAWCSTCKCWDMLANISQHLQVLRQAQLVGSRRDGNHIRYGLADRNVLRLWVALRELGEARLAEIDRLVETYLKDRKSLEAITCAELRRRIQSG